MQSYHVVQRYEYLKKSDLIRLYKSMTKSVTTSVSCQIFLMIHIELTLSRLLHH